MTATTNGDRPSPSMNEANERDPFNNNCYGTLVDQRLQDGQPAGARRDRFQRAHHPRLRGRLGRDAICPPTCPLARSLIPAGTATLRDFSNISPEIPEYIPENCTGCMDCVTECPDTAILGKVLSETELEEKLKTIPEADRAMYREQWSKTKKYYDAGKKKTRRRRHVPDHHRPVQVQGLRRVRHRLRRRRPQNDRQDRRGHDQGPQEPSLLQEHRPVQRQVHQRQPAHRHDAQGADAHLRRRRRLLRRLRRRDGPAHDLLRDRLEVRRPVGHRRGDRLQHGLHLDLSVQPVPGAVDQLAVRERPGRRHRRAHALGPDGLAGQADLVHRRRRRHVRHRLPGAVAPVRQRHEHQGVRARHAGLLQHRRPGLDQQLTPARTPR